MEHLSEEKMWRLVKYYMNNERGFDENNNLNEDFTNLAIEVNKHIGKCEVCKKKFIIMREKANNNKIKIEAMDEEKHGVKEENISEFENFDLDENSPIIMPQIVNPMDEMNFEITEEMVEYYNQNPDELENSNYTSAQKEAILRSIRKNMAGRQLVLTNNNSKGYVDALILSLITGFAGGIFVSIILMLCK